MFTSCLSDNHKDLSELGSDYCEIQGIFLQTLLTVDERLVCSHQFYH